MIFRKYFVNWTIPPPPPPPVINVYSCIFIILGDNKFLVWTVRCLQRLDWCLWSCQSQLSNHQSINHFHRFSVLYPLHLFFIINSFYSNFINFINFIRFSLTPSILSLLNQLHSFFIPRPISEPNPLYS